jgi:hypothetical protein
MEHDVDTAPEQMPEANASPGATICKIHNLRYDNRYTSGCVLCRRATEVVTPADDGGSGLLKLAVIAAIAAAVAGGAYAFYKANADPVYTTPAEMMSGSKSAHASCYEGCAQTHERCHVQCAGNGEAACPEYCMSTADSCFNECSGRYIKADPPWSYYYGTEHMPAWSAMLESSLGLHKRLLECSSEPPVNALAYVRVRGQDGAPQDVTVWQRDLPEPASECARAAVRATRFTPSEDGDYVFLARFDARYDGVRLLIAQAETEVGALPRLNSSDPGDAVKGRLFDAKVRLEKAEAPTMTPEAQLKEAKARLAAVNRKISKLSYGYEADDPEIARKRAEAARAREERAEEDKRLARERRTREETEHYRRLNREYREREERARYRQMWEE